LEQKVAAMLRPKVTRIARQVRDEAARAAPPAKQWVTAHDEMVRPSHREAHEQTIPANLRYQLPAMHYIHKGRDSRGKAINQAGGWKIIEGSYDLAVTPRDQQLPTHQKINCRCASVTIPGAVGRSVRSGEAIVRGSLVTATVWVRYRRVAESEFGTGRDPGAHFMAEARRMVAARYPARPA
jgi:hypothetical protein